MIVDEDVMSRLAQHSALGTAPAGEHAWLAAHGVMRTFAVGDVFVPKGTSATSLMVMFAGHITLHVDRGAGSRMLNEVRGGEVTGQLPFSRGITAPNDIMVEEAVELLEIPLQYMPEMIRECPVITATMVHAMLDRARHFTSAALRDEKLVSLGKLAAGLAHELNNPASAVARSAKLLTGSLATAEAAATAVGAARLSQQQLAAIQAVREAWCAPAAFPTLGVVARADREDAIGAWLAEHRVDDTCAGALAETGVTLAALDALATAVGAEALEPAICSIAAGCAVRALSSEIETAASRIGDLVDAVKGFTYMDHAPEAEPVDIRRGIGDTFTMLGAKTRAKAVDVSVRFDADLPRARAVGAELNQIWMNLVDNALDAVGPGGHVEVTASGELGHVVVQVTDDGPGIPPDIQSSIFDPFFTTKPVGQGTGLGLDIVRRLVQRHEGKIEFDSEPGRTRFRVILPMEP